MIVSEDHLARFLEDRESLSEEEFDGLLASLKADPELSRSLKDLLVVDGICAQTLAPDRQNFKAQVAQRLRDLQTGRNLQPSEVVQRFQSRPLPAARRPFWNWAALGATACAMLGLTLWLAKGPSNQVDETEVASLEAGAPGVQLQHAGSESAVNERATILNGDTVVNPTDAEVHLALRGEDSTVALKADSSLKLTRGPDATRVELLRGMLHAKLAQQDPRHPMLFSTPYGEVRVLGTELTLELRSGDMRLEVLHGRVNVTRKEDGESIVVDAGRAAQIGPGRELTAQLLAPAKAAGTDPSQSDQVPAGYTATPWRPIFDGVSLKGWAQDKGHWHVESGALVAATTKNVEQAALMFQENYQDFELRFSYLVEGNGYLEFRDRVTDGGSFQYSAKERDLKQWRTCLVRAVGASGSIKIDGKPETYEAVGDVSQAGKVRFYVQNRSGNNTPVRMLVKDVQIREFKRTGADSK